MNSMAGVSLAGAPESSVHREVICRSRVRLLSSMVPRQAAITALPASVAHP